VVNEVVEGHRGMVEVALLVRQRVVVADRPEMEVVAAVVAPVKTVVDALHIPAEALQSRL